VVRTSVEARVVPKEDTSFAALIIPEEDGTLAKGDRLAPPYFVVRSTAVPIAPTPPPNTRISKTEEVTTWHGSASSKRVVKRVRERN
jgi:hypothetical protein